MKTNVPPVSRLFFLSLFSFFLSVSLTASAQQTLTTINGWNAYVHLPDDYNTTGTQKYPCIIFFPGTGEVGTDASKVLLYGPGQFISQGWNGNVTINGTTFKPIIISLQPPAVYPQVPIVDQQIETIKTLYRVDPTRISLTGLSMGGWVAEMYVQTFPNKIASVVAIQAVRPDDNPAYPTPFATYAKDCGHWLGYEQINDNRDMITIYNTMTAAVPGSATYFQTNVGGGGHCCWNTWYDPTHTDPYSLKGVNGNWTIYQFMMTWSGCGTTNIAPTVNAGPAATITLPTSSVTLNGTATGNNGATISSVSWTKVSGGSATIGSPSSLSTAVTGLVAGTYSFKLTATDNHGLSSSSTVAVTVNSAVTNTPPIVSAGSAQTITLSSGGTAPSTGYFNFSNAAVAVSGWANMHGSPGSAVITAISNGITLNSVATANWAPYNGSTSFDGNGVSASGFFGNATVSSNNWFQYGDPAANFNAAKPQLQASGLVVGTAYTVKISGSDKLGFDTNPVRYTIIGSANYGPIDVNLDLTASNGATFSNVLPDASGKIRIYVNSVSGTSTAAEVNGLQIIPNTTSGTTQLATQSTATITLSGTASGTNGATITSTSWTQVSGTTTSISSPASLTTQVTGLVTGTYSYRLTATDNHGLTSSATVNVTVTTGTVTTTAKNVQVNLYGGQNPYSNSAWNNWNVSAAVNGATTSPAFNFSDGTASGITATLSTAQGIGDNGATYGGTIAPPEVLRYGSYNSFTRTLTLNNVPGTSLASLEIYGSRANTGNTSIYTINGVSKSLVTDFNLTGSVIFTNVAVTNGQIVITVNKSGSFNYINGFRLNFSSTTAAGGGSTQALTSEVTTTETISDLRPNLSVFPNPFDDVVNVKWNNNYTGTASLQIYSLDGKMISSRNIVKSQQEWADQIRLSGVSRGIYILQIKLPDGKSYVEKIIKR